MALGELNRYLVTGDLSSLRRARDRHLDAMANGAVADMKSPAPLAFIVVEARRSTTASDLREAISILKTALDVTPVGHTAYAWMLANIASDMGTLWEAHGEPHVLSEAIHLVQTHLHRLHDMKSNPDLAPLVIATSRCKLQGTLCRLHILSQNIEQAIAILLIIVRSVDVTPRARLHDAANLLNEIEAKVTLQATTGKDLTSIHQALGDIYREVVHILPVVASLGLDHNVQLDELEVTENLGVLAAMHVSTLEDKMEAVQLLEQARGVFWSQALRLRDPRIDLLPEPLANELKDLLRQLRTPEDSPLSRAYSLAYSSVTFRRVQQAERVQLILAEARTIPGMNQIFRGPSESDVFDTTDRGHVVILVGTLAEVFAIILPQGTRTTKRLPLPHVTISLIRGWIQEMEKVQDARGAAQMSSNVVDERGMRVKMSTRKATLDTSLHDIWLKIVQPIIIALNMQVLESLLLTIQKY
jgi:hypothetical protein